MIHWRAGFCNRVLSRGVFVAVKWAIIAEARLAVAARLRNTAVRLQIDLERDQPQAEDCDFEIIDRV